MGPSYRRSCLSLRSLMACALGLPKTGSAMGGEWAALLSPSPYHDVLAVEGCACRHASGLLADYRADAATPDQSMALAITDDHAAQEALDIPWWRNPDSNRGTAYD